MHLPDHSVLTNTIQFVQWRSGKYYEEYIILQHGLYYTDITIFLRFFVYTSSLSSNKEQHNSEKSEGISIMLNALNPSGK